MDRGYMAVSDSMSFSHVSSPCWLLGCIFKSHFIHLSVQQLMSIMVCNWNSRSRSHIPMATSPFLSESLRQCYQILCIQRSCCWQRPLKYVSVPVTMNHHFSHWGRGTMLLLPNDPLISSKEDTKSGTSHQYFLLAGWKIRQYQKLIKPW